MDYILKVGDYATHLKVNGNLKTEIEAVENNMVKFCDHDEWFPTSEVTFFAEGDGGFVK